MTSREPIGHMPGQAAEPGIPRRASSTRRPPTSRLRRICRTVLIVGTLCSTAAAFGPVWAVRLGVALAVVAAVVACTVAWAEVAELRRGHARDLSAAERAHAATLRDERRRNAAVVSTLAARIARGSAEARRGQVVIAQLRGDVARLGADRVLLQAEVRRHERTIAELDRAARSHVCATGTISEQDQAVAEVVWEEVRDEVLDLQMIDLALALPNYEHGGRVATG